MDEHESEMEMSPLTEAAMGVHELFLSLQRVGFTENQALYLVGQHLRSGCGDG